MRGCPLDHTIGISVLWFFLRCWVNKLSAISVELFIHDHVLRMTCPSAASSKHPHPSVCLSVKVTSLEGRSWMNGSHLRVASHLKNQFIVPKTKWLFIATCRYDLLKHILLDPWWLPCFGFCFLLLFIKNILRNKYF